MEKDSSKLIKRMRRFFIMFAALVLVCGLLLLAGNMLVILSAKPYVVKAEQAQEAECILVLGCGLNAQGEPGQHLRLRMDKAIELYRLGAAPKILVSGDHGREDYDEVNAMKRYAVQHGVPADDIFMDHAGFSTYESMVRADKVFGCKRVIVVTQEFHISRSVYDGMCQGMQMTGVCADEAIGYSKRYELYL